VQHAGNGPGGNRFGDYARFGTLLLVLLMLAWAPPFLLVWLV